MNSVAVNSKLDKGGGYIGIDVLGIYDKDIEYANSLTKYFMGQTNFPFEIRTFTEADSLYAYSDSHTIKILLISTDVMDRNFEHLSIDYIVFLSEGESLEDYPDYRYIYKYQSCEMILKELMEVYGSLNTNNKVTAFSDTQTKIIGVYSPIKRCGKTAAALSLANIMGSNTPTLYLSFETFSGFERITSKGDNRDLGDLMYYYLQYPMSLSIHLKATVSKLNDMDYIAPVRYCKDLTDVSVKTWIDLIKAIGALKEYDNIILDISDGVGDVYKMLDICSEIYLLRLNDAISQCKMEDFKESIFKTEYLDILDRIIYIDGLDHNMIHSREEYIEEIFWGSVRRYVQDVIVERDRTIYE